MSLSHGGGLPPWAAAGDRLRSVPVHAELEIGTVYSLSVGRRMTGYARHRTLAAPVHCAKSRVAPDSPPDACSLSYERSQLP